MQIEENVVDIRRSVVKKFGKSKSESQLATEAEEGGGRTKIRR